MNHLPIQRPVLLKSKILSAYPELRHAISTRRGGTGESPFGFNLSYDVGDDAPTVALNRKLVCEEIQIPEERIAFQRQIHSDTVSIVTQPGIYENCDGLITNIPELYLAVTVADCVPVLLYDPIKQCVAAIHSGWKGTQQNIVPKAFRKMAVTFGSTPSDILCFIGPGAGECCYDVGEGVSGLFPSEYMISREGKLYPNLKRMIYDSVRTEGVALVSIEVSPLCSICEATLLQSYRRDGIKSGRMMGIIGFRERE